MPTGARVSLWQPAIEAPYVEMVEEPNHRKMVLALAFHLNYGMTLFTRVFFKKHFEQFQIFLIQRYSMMHLTACPIDNVLLKAR